MNFLVSLEYVDPRRPVQNVAPQYQPCDERQRYQPRKMAPFPHPGLSGKRTFQKDFCGDPHLVTMDPCQPFQQATTTSYALQLATAFQLESLSLLILPFC